MRNHVFRQVVVVIALLLPASSPALAEVAMTPRSGVVLHSAPNGVVLADGWGIGHLFSGGGRTRVVQVSVVAMCIALFIMMRKFNG